MNEPTEEDALNVLCELFGHEDAVKEDISIDLEDAEPEDACTIELHFRLCIICARKELTWNESKYSKIRGKLNRAATYFASTINRMMSGG